MTSHIRDLSALSVFSLLYSHLVGQWTQKTSKATPRGEARPPFHSVCLPGMEGPQSRGPLAISPWDTAFSASDHWKPVHLAFYYTKNPSVLHSRKTLGNNTHTVTLLWLKP